MKPLIIEGHTQISMVEWQLMINIFMINCLMMLYIMKMIMIMILEN